MNHQGQPRLHRPANLFLEGLQLLLLELTAPVEVKAYLTDSFELCARLCRFALQRTLSFEHSFNGHQLLTPVGAYLFRVQTCHGVEVAGIALGQL